MSEFYSLSSFSPYAKSYGSTFIRKTNWSLLRVEAYSNDSFKPNNHEKYLKYTKTISFGDEELDLIKITSFP